MKFLVVDDSSTMRMLVLRSVKNAGFSNATFLEAGSGAEAMALLEEHRDVSCILSHWKLPERSGIDFLIEVRKALPEVPFGFVASTFAPDVHRRSEQEGASFVITEPFRAEAFAEVLGPLFA